MINKLLLISSLTLLITSCSTLDKFTNKDKEEEIVEEFIIDEQPQNEENFETVEEEQAEEINQAAQEEIEEVEVPDRVFFNLNSSTIDNKAQIALDIQAEWLKNDNKINIIIEGHCDDRGTREYNLALGEKRAIAAKKYLVASGINPNRIKVISYGKERPAFVGAGENIWSQNRRSVIIVQD